MSKLANHGTKSGQLPITADRLNNFADRLVREAQESITSSSRLNWVAITLLAFWWWSNITSFDLTGGKPGAPANRLAELVESQSETTTYCGPIHDVYGKEKLRNNGRVEYANSFTVELEYIVNMVDKSNIYSDLDKTTITNCQDAISDLSAIVKVVFGSGGIDVQGIKLSNVYIKYHPFVLFAILLIFGTILVIQRRKILSLIDEALHIRVERLNQSSTQIDYISLTRPWWLSYLPDWRYGNANVQLREVFSPRGRATGATILAFVLTIFVAGSIYEALRFQRQLRETAVDPRIKFFLNDDEGVAPMWLFGDGQYDMLALSALLVLVMVVADSVLIEQRPTRPSTVGNSFRSKRRFLHIAAHGMGIVVLASTSIWFADRTDRVAEKLIQTKAKFGLGSRPRFRPARPLARFANLSMGWFVLDSPIQSLSELRGLPTRIHFLRADKTFKGIFAPTNPRRLQTNELSESGHATTVSINLSAYSQGIEQSAIQMLKEGEIDGAIRLLWLGIEYDGPRKKYFNPRNIRLYDLLAGLLFRKKGAGELEGMIKVMENLLKGKISTSFAAALGQRLEKWRRPEGEWRKSWQSTSKRSWNGIDI